MAQVQDLKACYYSASPVFSPESQLKNQCSIVINVAKSQVWSLPLLYDCYLIYAFDCIAMQLECSFSLNT